MSKWGGIVGAALAGGIAGGAQAVGTIAQQEIASQELDRRSALEEAKQRRLAALQAQYGREAQERSFAHSKEVNADSQAFQASQNDANREFQRGQSEEQRNYQSMENDLNRDERSKDRASAERRHRESLAATRGEDKLVQVLDKEGNLRMATKKDLDNPENKYRPISAAATDQRADTAQMSIDAANIRSIRQAATQMPTKANKDKLEQAERAFEQKYGKRPEAAAPAEFKTVDDFIKSAVGG